MTYEWLAGFIDGEGCFMIQRHVKKKTHRVGYKPQMTIANTNLAVLQSIHEFLGCGHIHKSIRTKNPAHKLLWTFHIDRTADLQTQLPRVLPFLIVRKAQAEEMLAFLRLMRPGMNRRIALTPDEISARDVRVVSIRALNRRGVG